MDTHEPLPESEGALLAVLLKMPYHKRAAYALRLVNSHRNDPALLSLIQELLSTSLLPDHVPFPNEKGGNDYIKLLFPQSTASKRFWQRELGLSMASALGQPGLRFLLDAVVHPSMAGKSRVIMTCVSHLSGASDNQLVQAYHKSVPATQESLHKAMVNAGRVEALKILQLWKEPPSFKMREPCCVVLERELSSAEPRDRNAVWNRAGLAHIKPHHHLHDLEYVPKGSKADLVTTLFNLLELYPPPHPTKFKLSQDVPSIPSSLDNRIFSFLRCDLPRTLRLIRKTCFVPDPENRGRDLFKLPRGFMHQSSSARFWHTLSLEQQTQHLLPFILELMQMHNRWLLKTRRLISIGLLEHARWQIVVAVAENALTFLKNTEGVRSMSDSERNGIMAFVVEAINTLVSRLYKVAHREDRVSDRVAIERGLEKLLCDAIDRILTASKVSASSDHAFVQSFMRNFLVPVLNGPLKQYPPLVETLFNRTTRVFDVTQMSKSELVPSAVQFFFALKGKTRSVFDIPDDGVVQPFCDIRETDNDTVFRLLLRLEPPRDNPSFYVDSVLNSLSKQQRGVIWTHFNDPEYVYAQLFGEGGVKNAAVLAQIFNEMPNSPRARLHIVKGILNHPNVDEYITSRFYPLLDTSDAPSRELLEKNSYKRLFADRYVAYEHLLTATWAQESPKEYVKTMRFLVPRIKNEIAPDAKQIVDILNKKSVGDILHLMDHATVDEAEQLAEIYLAWEKQNNEAVSRVLPISDYILNLGKTALLHFAGFPAYPLFHFGMDLLWVREVCLKGSLKARETHNIRFYTNLQYKLTEDEELERRRFLLASKDALGRRGYWRISDERQFVDILLQQYHKIHQAEPFDLSPAYAAFISSMLEVLGTRWVIVPSLIEYTERQLGVLRAIPGSKEKPADWNGKAQRESIQYILRLRALYDDAKVKTETLPWWSEFRRLRLFSTDTKEEVNLLYKETFDAVGKPNQEQLDMLVESLLSVDDTAVYLHPVRVHLMSNRQDLLKESHVTCCSTGLFNQLPDDTTAQAPVWNLTFPRRLFPHQCELFAAKLLETIHSEGVPLQNQVSAAEELTKLPTTTIIELAELLKEDLNPRILEAILMFLPHLDEPASAIQFLLAPKYLGSDLARTVIFSVRNSLQHVPADSLPKILIPIFPPEDSKRQPKVTVMKELVRLVCQHISFKEHQTFLMGLWKRKKLHQDVRIALLQSIISFLDSKQENLAWTILRYAVTDPALALDDTLFALLAVRPSKPGVEESDVDIAYGFHLPGVLTDMANHTIPDRCHETYVETVLHPLTQASLLGNDVHEKDANNVRERLRLLQQSAYHVIFSHFIRASNALIFSRRGLDAAKRVAFCDTQADDLFPLLVYGIGKCVTFNVRCWDILCQLVDFLACAVGSPGKEPTRTSLKAVQRLRAMNLGFNMTFQRPPSIRKQLKVDRMSLLQPLTRHGCDHFAVITWNRRFHLFSCERIHSPSEKQPRVSSSELDQARSLLLELTHLSNELQVDLSELKSKTSSLMDTASTLVENVLVGDLLSGGYGLDEVAWINELRLHVLSRRIQTSLDDARSLAAFQTQMSNYHTSFYARHSHTFQKMIESILKSDPMRKSADSDLRAVLLDPIFERLESSPLDVRIIRLLLNALPDVIVRHRPQWVIESINAGLSSLYPWKADNDTLLPALQLVEFVNTSSIQSSMASTVANKPSDFSPLAALLVETIYNGTMRNFDLARVISSSLLKTEPVLVYPYFVVCKDGESGGDMENRRCKSTVPQLLDRYQEWKSSNAAQYTSGTHRAEISPSVLPILNEVLKRFPQLALVHPSLFISYAALTMAQSELDTRTKIDGVLSHIQKALTPTRQGETGPRWGWAPPLSLALSFAQVLFSETAGEVAEFILDEYADMGIVTSKLAALQLLEWWVSTFYVPSNDRDWEELVKAMEREEGRENTIMRQYDELRLLACRDESRVVREKAFNLRAGDSLKR